MMYVTIQRWAVTLTTHILDTNNTVLVLLKLWNFLLGQLDHFYCDEIRLFDIDFSDIECDLTSEPITSGPSSNIYHAKFKGEGHMYAEVQVTESAIKVRHQPLSKKNATECLLEEENLR